MSRLVLANQATAAKRRAYFDCRDATDGITPETGEAAGQPQIATNGGAFTNTGIGTLTAIGNGRYYADVTQAAVATAGDVIETRYKSAATAETPGDTFQIVAFDLDAAIAQTGDSFNRIGANGAGLSNLTTATGIATPTNITAATGVVLSGVTHTGAVIPTVSVLTGHTAQTADHTAGIAGIPTTAEFNARTLPAVAYFDPAVDAVANVTLVATTTTNTDMVGTDGALTDKAGFSLSTAGILAIWHQLTSAILTAGTIGKLLKDNIDAAISSRNATAPPTAAQNRAEMDSNSTELSAIKGRLPAALTGAGNMKSDALAMDGSTAAAANLKRAALLNQLGTVTSGTNTTLVSDIVVTKDDQLKGAVIVFALDTTTVALRGERTAITACTAATNTLTFTALAVAGAPVSGDTFELI